MMAKAFQKVSEHRWALLFLGLFLAFGLFAVGDYGITWDEQYQRDYGQFVHHYVHYDDTYLHEYKSRYHGPAFQYMLYLAEHWLKPADPGDVYRLRHLLTFLFSVVGIGFFYLLCLEIFRKRNWALLGMVLLTLSPRIFSHSFYNSKDATFMYMFIIAVYTMLVMLRNLNWRTMTAHAIVCAFLIDIRILGAFVPIFTGILLLPRLMVSSAQTFRLLPKLAAYGLLVLFGMVLFWPTLWHAPLAELINALKTMSAYPWDSPIRFGGAFVTPRELPWHYLLTWMLITTPLIHLFLIAAGAVVVMFKGSELHWEHRLTVLLWAILPIWAITNRGATVYDGWRHVYFLWPVAVIMAVAGARWLMGMLEVRVPSVLPWTVLILLLCWPARWIVVNHPHQAVFFNSLAVDNAGMRYELDYWGGSYKQALEWLVQHVPEGEIRICPVNLPGHLNQMMLPEEQRERLGNVGLDDAQYVISNHRYPNEFDPYVEKRYPYSNPVFQISVDGNIIVGVYHLR